MNTIPKPPKGLSPEARALWRQVLEEFDLTASGQTLLRHCCETLDRVRQAQAEVARHGLVMDGAIKRLNPAHRVETDAKKLFLAYWRELGLDLAPPLTGGR